MWRRAVVACLVVCCKGSSNAPPPPSPPQPGSATAATTGSSGSAAGSAHVEAARRPPPKLVPADLKLDDIEPESFQQVEAIAFHGKRPHLPALSADSQVVADYEFLLAGGMPVSPEPVVISLTPVGSAAPTEHLVVLDIGEAQKLWDRNDFNGSAWVTPEMTKKLEQRGAAVLERLKTFHTLVPVDASAQDQPIKIGNLVLDPGADPGGGPLVIELHDGAGEVLHRTRIEPYQTGSDMSICSYTPRFGAAYRDAATRMLYVQPMFHFRDDCDIPTEPPLDAWSEDPADASPADAIASIVERQFDVLGARPADRSRLAVTAAPVVTAGKIGSFDHVDALGLAKSTTPLLVHGADVTIARDGMSAWATASVSLSGSGDDDGTTLRASDVLVRTKDGWRIAAMAWTVPVPDAQADRDARAGKRKLAALSGVPGDDDASLRDAFAKLASDGVDAAAAARKDLAVIGTAPDEHTLGGAVFANGWNAIWKGKVAIASSVARVLPSGTTGWVAATVELAKPGVKVPVTMFAVFDKTATGQWSLVHVHFAA